MRLLPPSTNNAYTGARSSVWFLFLTGLLTLLPGLIHAFLPDGGAQTIAHLDVGNRRDLVIGVFRWEGATQLAYGAVILMAAIRYQTLTPFMLLVGIFERGLMAVEGWILSPPASGLHPPEHYASAVFAPIALVFLILSLRNRRA
jgi:hypothetical protein